MAFFTKIFLDNILLGGQRTWLPGLLTALLVSAGLMAILTGLKRYYLIRLYTKFKKTSSSQFFWHLLQLPLKFFQQRATGDIAERVEAHSYLADILADKMTSHIASIFIMLGFAVAMCLLNWPLAVVNIAITMLNFCLLWAISRRNIDLGRRFVQTDGKLSGIEMNGIQIIETLKANAVENQFFKHWAAVHAQKIESEQQIAKNENYLRILPIFSQGLNIVILLGLGSWFIMHNQLSPGGLIAIQILLIGFNRPLIELLEVSEYFYKLKGDVARIADVKQQATEDILSSVDTTLNLSTKTPQPLLELRQVQFGYSKLEPPIFANISLKINAGERVAIVGPTGGGKSSMAKLICGLYAPWSGEILLQDVPLREVSRAHLASLIGVVDQHIFLFAASIRDNLTLWNPKIADNTIYQALKIAHIDEVVRERGGLECWVEERGRNFSGGQVQRLEIARALLGNPQLLILDEATAALDPLVEQKIYANLRRQHCTLVIIAHRLSTIRDCDQIIVIDEGRIVQQGRHELLIEDSGLYKELVSLEIQ